MQRKPPRPLDADVEKEIRLLETIAFDLGRAFVEQPIPKPTLPHLAALVHDFKRQSQYVREFLSAEIAQDPWIEPPVKPKLFRTYDPTVFSPE